MTTGTRSIATSSSSPSSTALTGDHAGGHVDGEITGNRPSLRDGRLDAVGDEEERGVRMGVGPLSRDGVGHHDHRDVEVVAAVPAVGDVEEGSAADQHAEARRPATQVLGALGGEVKGPVASW